MRGDESMSKFYTGPAARRLSLVCIAAMTLVACDDEGRFALPTGSDSTASAPMLAANAPNQTRTSRDVERPDLFGVTDRGLWDGRPSLGGAWVAHPDVSDPERVLIVNTETGREITGALFRRERDNPGPTIQVSSDAAEALGMLPGAPTELRVVALRREEVEVVVPPVAETPIEADLAEPESIATEPLAPAAGAVVVDLPPAVEAAASAIEQTSLAAADQTQAVAAAGAEVVDVSSVITAPNAPADGPRAQIGVFSVEANANQAASQINDAGIAANVLSETMGGRTVWRVVAGPLVDESVLAQLKALGFVDAFVLGDAE